MTTFSSVIACGTLATVPCVTALSSPSCTTLSASDVQIRSFALMSPDSGAT
jgi:hypothetical protein